MKIKIIENEERTGSRESADLDLLLTPLEGSTVQDIEQALENRDLYGSYLANTRDKASVNKAIEDYFGPTLPTKRKPLEKLRGEPFPIKTKQAMDDLLMKMEGKPNLLTYEVIDGEKILFPTKKNYSKQTTTNILKQVLGSAGIKYKLENFENLAEYSKPLQEVKRMQKLAGITEIKVE